ncbi:hypothetical protein ACU8OL_32725 (plasmid) [Rhizobium leguminosarum]
MRYSSLIGFGIRRFRTSIVLLSSLLIATFAHRRMSKPTQQVRSLSLRESDTLFPGLAFQEWTWLCECAVEYHQLVSVSRKLRLHDSDEQKSESKLCDLHRCSAGDRQLIKRYPQLIII